MAVKSVIDIELNGSENFEKFAKLFAKYQDALAKTPNAWANAGKEVKGVKTAFEAGAAALIAQHELSKHISDDSSKIEKSADKSARSWRDMGRSAKTFAGHIKSAAEGLLKFSVGFGLFSGVLATGGLFGIDRLAASVAGGRYSSQGLGTSYGSQKSFGINYSRVVDPGSFLAAVSSARGDLSKRSGFYGAGMSEAELGGDTASVSAALLKHLKDIADHTDPKMIDDVIRSRNLGQFVSGDDMRRLKAMSPEEFKKMQSSYRGDLTSLALSDETQRKWQDFTVQMGRAGEQIENIFVKGLVRIEPGLEKLSVSVEKVIDAFLNNKDMDKWLDKVDIGLEKFANFIGTPEFEQDVKDFVSDIGALAKAVVNGLQFLGVIPTKTSDLPGPKTSAEAGEGWRNTQARFLRRPHGGKPKWVAPEGGIDWQGKTDSSNTGVGSATQGINWTKGKSDRIAKMREYAKKYGLDPDIFVWHAQKEGLNKYEGDYVNGVPTSFGDFQLHLNAQHTAVGDQFLRDNPGIDLRDKKTWPIQDEYAAKYIAKHGYHDWSSNAGHPNNWGVGVNKPSVTIYDATGSNTTVIGNAVAQ